MNVFTVPLVVGISQRYTPGIVMREFIKMRFNLRDLLPLVLYQWSVVRSAGEGTKVPSGRYQFPLPPPLGLSVPLQQVGSSVWHNRAPFPLKPASGYPSPISKKQIAPLIGKLSPVWARVKSAVNRNDARQPLNMHIPVKSLTHTVHHIDRSIGLVSSIYIYACTAWQDVEKQQLAWWNVYSVSYLEKGETLTWTLSQR